MERCEALLAVTMIRHAFSYMIRSVDGECHESRDRGTINDDSILCGDIELAW
jgi:hypothetical protein